MADEKKPHRPSAKARNSSARLRAIQALYQMALGDGQPAGAARVAGVINEFTSFRFGEEVDGERMVMPNVDLFRRVVEGVAGQQAELDEMVRGALDPKWSPERLELLVLIIMRAGAWELWANPDVPGPVVASDYVNAAHAFFAGKEPGLINAVLDRLRGKLRAGETQPRSPEGGDEPGRV